MQITEYTLTSPRLGEDLRIALVADLHDFDGSKVLTALRREKPDAVAIAGDLVDRSSLDLLPSAEHFLRQCVAIAPTFYSLGNHERILLDAERDRIQAMGVELLDNRWILWRGCAIGGLSTDARHVLTDGDRLLFRENTRLRREMGPVKRKQHRREDENFRLLHRAGRPDLTWLPELEAQEGFRLLLCHHPEYYSRYLKDRALELILSGHAHGGQIRLFGQGILAPGQGLFPKYSGGFYDGMLIVSRGLSNPYPIVPRLGNPKELVFIRLLKKRMA